MWASLSRWFSCSNLFIIIADSLVKHPEYHPELIVWFPVIVAEFGGFLLIQRNN